jgi:nicotinamide-nucleotide amidase
MADGDEATIDGDAAATARAVAARLQGRTMAAAESFTAGLLAQTLASVPSSSDWFDGSLVAYRTEQKRRLLGVAVGSPFTEGCARQMAVGAASLFGADVALATTGVAGPDDQDGVAAGTVMIGWVVDGADGALTVHLGGDPEQVVQLGVRAALSTLLDHGQL